MNWRKRVSTIPGELISAIPAKDRFLAWAEHSGGLLGVTDKNLISIEQSEVSLTSWSISLQARWEPPMLTLVTQQESDSEPISQTWTLSEPGLFPSAVRDRVTAAVVVDRIYDLPTAGRVRFVARRSGQSITWIAVADDLAATQSPDGAKEVAQGLSELKSIFGI